jgi:ribosomal protein S18 acetylase RimI-like enzyme
MDDLDSPPGELDVDRVEVRILRESDLDWVVRIDAQRGGRMRPRYFEIKLAESARDTSVRISLAGLIKGEPAGFLMARVYYGEFGQPEPVAILDSIGVAPAFGHRHVAKALLRQLEMNLAALGIERLETQVDWRMRDLLGFFERAGFGPAPRLCLEKKVERPQ